MADDVEPAQLGRCRERAVDVSRIQRPIGRTFEHAVRDAVARRLFDQARGEEPVGGDQPRAQARQREQAGLVGARARRRHDGRVIGGGIADSEQRDQIALDRPAQRAEPVLAVVVAGRIGERARDRGRHAHRPGREQDRRGRAVRRRGRRRDQREARRIERRQRRDDLVRAAELRGGTGRREADAAKAGRARRAQPGGRVLDGDRVQRRPGRRLQPRARQTIALRIGLAARDVLGRDHHVEGRAQRRRVEHVVDLGAPRPRHDRQARAGLAQRPQERARPETEPRVPARERGVHVLLFHDQARQPFLVGRDRAAVVREQRDDRVPIVEAEDPPVDVVLDREVKHGQRAPERLEVNVLVIDEDAVEIEQDGKRHRDLLRL